MPQPPLSPPTKGFKKMKVIPPQKDSKKPTTLKKNESYTPPKGFKKSDHTKNHPLSFVVHSGLLPFKKKKKLILFGGRGGRGGV
jgi:hypothetical protein